MAQERLGRAGRRLAAILAADLAGYSRLMHDDEEGTHARLTAVCTKNLASGVVVMKSA
jgi:adenylate cyclase